MINDDVKSIDPSEYNLYMEIIGNSLLIFPFNSFQYRKTFLTTFSWLVEKPIPNDRKSVFS